MRMRVTPGDRWGSLVALREVDPTYWRKYAKRMVECLCDCGNTTTVRLEYLRSGHTLSCGCQRLAAIVEHTVTHASTHKRLYGIWRGMKARCLNPHTQSYQHYGAKGVQVCEGWQRFEAFSEWAEANGYTDSLTIDRIDPCGNYEPCNCRWVPKSAQSGNRRPKVPARA